MEFIETPTFTRLVLELLEDEDYGKLQATLANRPDMGRIIIGSSGVRKMRWAGRGRGKRGGLRVIYYWHATPEIIIFLDIYPKNEKDNLTQSEIRLLNLLLED